MVNGEPQNRRKMLDFFFFLTDLIFVLFWPPLSLESSILDISQRGEGSFFFSCARKQEVSA